MAALKFLGIKTKVVICLLGIALMGYFLYQSIQEGFVADGITILRVIVLLGFAYFLVKNAHALFTGSDDSGHPS
ncbi:MAG: hypothetical protein LDL33_11115 [Desulfomonile sp.]|nr:hypothetical protein [Desulfomonile sp.]